MDTATIAAVAPIGVFFITSQVALWHRLGKLEGQLLNMQPLKEASSDLP